MAATSVRIVGAVRPTAKKLKAIGQDSIRAESNQNRVGVQRVPDFARVSFRFPGNFAYGVAESGHPAESGRPFLATLCLAALHSPVRARLGPFDSGTEIV